MYFYCYCSTIFSGKKGVLGWFPSPSLLNNDPITVVSCYINLGRNHPWLHVYIMLLDNLEIVKRENRVCCFRDEGFRLFLVQGECLKGIFEKNKCRLIPNILNILEWTPIKQMIFTKSSKNNLFSWKNCMGLDYVDILLFVGPFFYLGPSPIPKYPFCRPLCSLKFNYTLLIYWW